MMVVIIIATVLIATQVRTAQLVSRVAREPFTYAER